MILWSTEGLLSVSPEKYDDVSNFAARLVNNIHCLEAKADFVFEILIALRTHFPENGLRAASLSGSNLIAHLCSWVHQYSNISRFSIQMPDPGRTSTCSSCDSQLEPSPSGFKEAVRRGTDTVWPLLDPKKRVRRS
ncbi:Hypothetical protein Deide_3p02182 (plasmid) [Deinococcus deserti VCD115]|uniref:Uncharacterized protein n=1 Tax=Deinococcus deserti (strain DSM 17065 / CIP 109153 / LMG 22923 / VCD115) TaxID=546414 RepID=C1D3U7_DEIDV|nr:Hypothetical protein Deide_3p02182 [Deinococcus deserti VCD115]